MTHGSHSRWGGQVALVLAIGIALIESGPARAEVALEVDLSAPDNVFPNSGTTHGWQFFVNGPQPIEVTHLGLYDRFLDGFFIDHPIGLWDEKGQLLASDVMSAGNGDPLIDNFRYVDITDNDPEQSQGQGVVLTPGVMYTLGFYSESFNQSDGMVIFDGFHTINPAIDYVGFGVSGFTDGLEMPVTPDEFGLHRWGPNFQFTIIPAPAALLLLGLGMLRPRRQRK